jgi:hypothetical protein
VAIGILELLLILPFAIFWLWMLIYLKRPDDKFAIGGNNAKLI